MRQAAFVKDRWGSGELRSSQNVCGQVLQQQLAHVTAEREDLGLGKGLLKTLRDVWTMHFLFVVQRSHSIMFHSEDLYTKFQQAIYDASTSNRRTPAQSFDTRSTQYLIYCFCLLYTSPSPRDA